MPEAVVKTASRNVLVENPCRFPGGKDTMFFFTAFSGASAFA